MHFPSENTVPPGRLERPTNSLGNRDTARNGNDLAHPSYEGASAGVRRSPQKSADLSTGLATSLASVDAEAAA